MPRFTPRLQDANSTVVLLEDGDYLFEVGAPKTFARKNKEGGDVYGIVHALLVMEGQSNVGKTIPQQMYLHTPGSLDMTKRFYMAALGYNPNDNADEEKFNDTFSDEAAYFGIDTEANFIGEVYQRAAGTNIAATVKQVMSKPKDGSEPRMQNQFSWRAVS